MSGQKFTGDLAAILDLLPDDFRLAAETARAISQENDLKSPPTLLIEFGSKTVVRMVSGDKVLAEREITLAEYDAIKHHKSIAAPKKLAPSQSILPNLVQMFSSFVEKSRKKLPSSFNSANLKEQIITWLQNPHIPLPKFKGDPLTTTLFLALLTFAAYPSWLVYKDRWLGEGPPSRPYYETIWESWDFFSKLILHRYFSVIFISLAALLLLSLFLKDFSPKILKSILHEEIGEQDASKIKVDDNRWHRGRNIMIVAGLVIVISGASAMFLDSLPGIIFAFGIFGLLIGRWMIDIPAEQVREIWRQNALPWLTMLASHISLIFLLSANYSRPNLLWLAFITIALSGLALWNLRRQISPIFWVLSFALVIHTYSINEWWYAVIGDEYSFYRMAVEIGQRQTFETISADFFRGDYVYGTHPYISSFMQAVFIKIFGDNNFAWRFSSIYFSILGIGFLYKFLKYFVSNRLAVVAALLLASSQYLMGFGKIGYNSLQAFFAMALLLWAAAWAIHSKKPFAFMLLGVTEGFCFYVFPAALYVTPLPILLLLIYYWPKNLTAIKHWGLALLALLVTIFPLLLQPKYWSTKIPGTIYYVPKLLETSSNIVDQITTNFAYAFLSPLYIINESHFISIGYTDLITAPFVFLGFACLLWRFWQRRFTFFIFVGYIFLLFAVGTTHPNEYPPNTRMFVLLPWFAILAVFGLVWLSRQIRKMGFSELSSWRTVQVLVAIIIVVNLQQAYVITQERSTRYYHFTSLFLRSATELLEDSTDPGNIMILYSPDTMYIPSLLEILDLYQVPYNPDQVLGFEEPPGLDEAVLALAADPSTLVFVDPGLSEEIQQAYAELLTNSVNKLDCPITVLGSVRYHMWYSPEQSWLCPPSD